MVTRLVAVAILTGLFSLAGCSKGTVNSGEGPCKDQTCSDHGHCVVANNVASCDCDDGYHAVDLTCVDNGQNCVDGDGDGRGTSCTAGADCNDSDENHWADCGACVDTDGDDYGTGCDKGADCDDADNTKWATCGGSAVLTWEAPTKNADGTDLTDLAGYRVHYGNTVSAAYSEHVAVGNVVTHTVDGLESGKTYYFAVTALDTTGNESVLSNEATKAIP
jgi:hypothetical protein